MIATERALPLPTPLRLVVIDDERNARLGLRELLGTLPGVEIVGEADDVGSAITCIRDTEPDGILLDIQLPSGTGFQVLDGIATTPAVVFVTAHDAHAVAAFELAALDYVLKPYTRERLLVAIDRMRRSVGEAAADGRAQWRHAEEGLQETATLSRVFVRRGRRIMMLPVADIVRIEADGMYTRIISERDVFVATIPLSTLVKRLPGDQFLRIHRSHVVNLSAVAAFGVVSSGRLEVEMRNGLVLPCSREYARVVRDRAW